jgi:two-component system sensor histidine kinase RpfC
MQSTENNTHWIGRLRNRLKKTGDSEPEQAKLRLAIGVLLVLYFCFPWAGNETFSESIVTISSLITLAYYTFAFLIFLAIILNPVASPARRVCGATLDMISLSIVMYFSGGDSVALFALYLWVILGNGFRFGVKYLYISQAISIVGFSIAALFGSYWIENKPFAISLLMMLGLIPLYSAFLIKKLHAAIDMAKHANEAKSRFLANMSHELRTPLNGVIGMGDLLRETNLSFEQRELVGTLHSSANTLLELIENVLDIAKIESGKINIESNDLDLHAVINSVIYMLTPMGEAKDITLSCNIDPETPFALKGDHQHIRQVLINLVNNALKFTEKGHVNLNVRRSGGTEDKPIVLFEISDTGIGIAEEYLDIIFDDFTQAKNSNSRSSGGTGLGTAISKELVELMGGEIGVDSKLGAGSKFWFELPFTAIENDDTLISENHVLLLCEEETASIIRPALKSWSVDFDWVRTPARAISQLVIAREKNHPYETVIVDQASLTDINAVRFAQMIKTEGLLDNTSLVLVNSSDTMIDANKINHYFISTLENPADKRLLFNTLHAAQSVNINDSNIVTLAEHYAKQKGSKILKILVAEDNLVNQQVIGGVLRHAGHNVRIADNGEKALDILSNDPDNIEMLIVDMNMPEVSGIEVVKSLRFMDTSASLPVIMLTADATPEAKEASLQAGANAFLTKPIEARVLLETIASLSRKPGIVKLEKQRKKPLTTMAGNTISESPWYNENVLLELSMLSDDPSFIQSLVANFIKDGEKRMDAINSSMLDDYLGYREGLHALKGSATELGAEKLVEICQKCEVLKPYDIGTDKIKTLVHQLEHDFTNTVSALGKAISLAQDQMLGNSE